MIDDLITRTFAARNSAQLQHWRETSGYRHETLAEFYDGVIPLLDRLVEAHIAVHGSLKDIPSVKTDMKEVLFSELAWLSENREAVCNKMPALQNMYDELTGQYLKTIYKMERLK